MCNFFIFYFGYANLSYVNLNLNIFVTLLRFLLRYVTPCYVVILPPPVENHWSNELNLFLFSTIVDTAEGFFATVAAILNCPFPHHPGTKYSLFFLLKYWYEVKLDLTSVKQGRWLILYHFWPLLMWAKKLRFVKISKLFFKVNYLT